MKTILTDNEAIEAYKEIFLSGTVKHTCGYFVSDDCSLTDHWDKGTIIAFDGTSGEYYEDGFPTVTDAVEFIER